MSTFDKLARLDLAMFDSMAEIGRHVGVTRERIRQILEDDDFWASYEFWQNEKVKLLKRLPDMKHWQPSEAIAVLKEFNQLLGHMD